MAQHRGVADWFAIAKGYGVMGFEHSADVFCHYCGTPTEGFPKPTQNDVQRLSPIDARIDHPMADKGVVAGND